MKIYLLTLAILFSACSSPNEKVQKNILPEKIFKDLLKDIHLAEANFKIKNTINNKTQDYYFELYTKYNTSQEDFQKTLKYYSEKPEKLEPIYTQILEELIKERANLEKQ